METGNMHMKKCGHCHRTFFASGREYVCQDCKEKDQQEFDQIVEYLVMHPGSNAMEIAAGLKIPVMDILMYLNEGKLKLTKEK